MNKVHDKEIHAAGSTPANSAESILVKILLGTFYRSFFEAIAVKSSYYPKISENETTLELLSQIQAFRGAEEEVLKILEPVIPFPLEELEKHIITEHLKENNETAFIIHVVSHREWLRMLKAIFLKMQNGQIIYTNVIGAWMDKTKTVEYYSIYKVGLCTVMIGIREICGDPPNIQIYGTTVDCRLPLIKAYDDFEYYVLNTAKMVQQERIN